MVSTRSRDLGASDVGLATLVAKESPMAHSGKRRARHEVDVSSRGPPTKRRRTAAATENDTRAIDSISIDVNDLTRLDIKAGKFLGVQIPCRPEDGDNVGVTQRAMEVGSVEDAEGPMQSVSSKELQTELTSSLETRDSSENDEGTINAVKAIHKRFGSEELELQQPQPNSNIAPEIHTQQASKDKIVSSDEASEDEAPETMTAAASFKRARAAAAHAAKIIERKEAATKKKRKERDARLNFQANSSRKRGIVEADQPKTSPKSKNEVIGNVPIHDEAKPKAPLSAVMSVPRLLPESILLAQPPSPLPNRPSDLPNAMKTTKTTLATKRNLLEHATKPPKDVKYGSRTIRVLETHSGRLPPRVSHQSKAIREAWLAGRRSGSRGERGFVPRRKVGGGFVRK